jgi:hypothetical protein
MNMNHRSRFLGLLTVLLLVSLPVSRAQTIMIGNLGGVTGTVTQTASQPIFYIDSSLDYWAAAGFTIGSTAYTFDHATAPFYSLYSDAPTTVEGGIYSNSAGHPGALLAAFSAVSVAGQATASATYNLTLASGTFQFAANTSYWLVLHDAAPGPLWVRTGPVTTPTGLAGIAFDGYRESSNGGGAWTSNGDYDIMAAAPSFDIYVAAAIPEPSTYAAIAGAVALGLTVAIRRRQQRTGAGAA